MCFFKERHSLHMYLPMNKIFVFVYCFWFNLLNVSAQQEIIMDFTPAEVNFANWNVVNDGVMGGLSKGKLRFENRILYFSGELSLANNGGFSLIRTETYNLNLSEFDGISIRVKGDGREYQMRLNTVSS